MCRESVLSDSQQQNYIVKVCVENMTVCSLMIGFICVYELNSVIKYLKCTFTEKNIYQSLSGTSLPDRAEDPRSKYTVTAVVVGFFILITIIVIMTVIRNKKPNINTSFRFQKRMFLYLRHNEDNSDHPEDVISAAV